MNIDNLVCVAHPDDEAIWFSSILQKLRTLLVICFQNIPYDQPERNVEYTDAAFEVINELSTHCPTLWLQTIKTTKPRIWGEFIGNTEEHLRTNLCNVIMVTEPENVYTHNPWGEYGHSEHKVLHKVLRDLREDVLFPDACLNGMENSTEYQMAHPLLEVASSEPVDCSFKEGLRTLYKSKGIWTAKTDFMCEPNETFLRYRK